MTKRTRGVLTLKRRRPSGGLTLVMIGLFAILSGQNAASGHLPSSAKARQGLHLTADRSDAQPRVVKFPGGQVTIERNRETEHVVITGDDGKLRSESWCPAESGTYDQLSGFFRAFQAAVRTGRQNDVVSMLRFPFRVNGGGGRTYTKVDDLKPRYRQIFTSQVVKRIGSEEPAAVFCRNGQAMVAEGTIWVHAEDGIVKADVLNRY